MGNNYIRCSICSEVYLKSLIKCPKCESDTNSNINESLNENSNVFNIID
jgi:formate dehydrogenase maturation protein FdhE